MDNVKIQTVAEREGGGDQSCRRRMKGDNQLENGTYKQSQEQNEAVASDGIADEVMILVEKKAGEEKYRLKIEASRAAAAMNGIALLVVEYANSIGVSVESAVAVLATVLLAPDKKEA